MDSIYDETACCCAGECMLPADVGRRVQKRLYVVERMLFQTRKLSNRRLLHMFFSFSMPLFSPLRTFKYILSEIECIGMK